MCLSFCVPVSRWWNSVPVLECPPVRRESRAVSTSSSRANCVSDTPDQASAQYNKLFTRILCLRRSPASTLFVPISTSPRMPIIWDIFPHPFFLLSSIVSCTPPLDDSIFPRYFVHWLVSIGSLCTFSFGHGSTHFAALPMCTTTDFSLDSVECNTCFYEEKKKN